MSDVILALTLKGQSLKAKIEMGNGTVPLEITRITAAAGTSDDPLSLTAAVDERQRFIVKSSVTSGPRTMITALMTNAGNPDNGEPPVAVGYPLSQIAFYAIDPDEGEILYRISQFETPNYVPAANERGWTYEPTFNIVTGNASEVVIQVNPLGYATKSDIWSSIEMSDAALPGAGTRLHFLELFEVPDYTTPSF